MPHSEQPSSSPARRERRRRTHQRIDSNGDIAPRSRRRRDEDEDRPRRRRGDEYDYEDAQTSPSKQRPRRREHERERRSSRAPESEYTSSRSSGAALSSAQLAQLNHLNQKLDQGDIYRPKTERRYESERRTEYGGDFDRERDREAREQERERGRQERHDRKRQQRREERRAAEAALAADDDNAHTHDAPKQSRYRRKEGRVASGQALERGGSEYYSEKETMRDDVRMRGGGGSSEATTDYDEDARRRKKRRNWCIAGGVIALILVIVIPVGVVLGNKKGGGNNNAGSSGTAGGSTAPSNSNLDSVSQSDIPESARGGLLDPFDWYDTTDFNVTYTDQTVAGLSVMGLNSTWDDTKRANDNTPPLNEKWEYGKMKYRGINLGGWLYLEPFINPSFFEQFTSADGVVDEWTFCEKLGPLQARTQIEPHYSSWINEQTFVDIQAAGFDHVRVPFGYWAVTTYDGDPFIPQVAWRYLLRAIEWARKYGLRIYLDLHGAPGSQNGWNHSGRQGAIGWLNGTDGQLNGQRTIDIHKQLSEFFTQERYKNIVTMIGLVNEPKMTALDADVVRAWSANAIKTIRANNFDGLVIIGDGFMGLDNWQGEFTGEKNLILDAHQYVIFNVQQLVLNHYDKISFACEGWTEQSRRSMNTATGFGPTMFGEWSQADTDCAQYLNNFGVGSRWEGTLNMVGTPGGASSGNVLTPTCPTANNPRCSCEKANADPGQYSETYKLWLKTFAQAQMDSFEVGWGWFYWTWVTERATQWSYKDALAAGIMPELAYQRDWNCSDPIPDFNGLGLEEYY